jgi:hypothetical protein
MANTSLLRSAVEDYVRKELRSRHGLEFSPRFLKLRTGGQHEFDAVSSDGNVIASVKSASGLTAAGNVPDGKIKNCIAELYYLSLVGAPIRILVLTTPAFYEIFTRKMTGAIANGVEVKCIPLPPELQLRVDEVVRTASKEVSPAVIQELAKQAVESEVNDE